MTFVRYLLIQVVAYAIDMGVFILSMEALLFGALSANVLAKICAGVFAFICHQRFTFAVQGQASQPFKYFSLLMINIPLASGLLALCLLLIENAIAAKFIADVACVALTYVLCKYFIFTEADLSKKG